jgi:acetyl/propionyl-CoA carboxylase alpha subunit
VEGVYHYSLTGAESSTGVASVFQVMPGVYSILDGFRSFLVTLAETDLGMEAWIDDSRYLLAVSDSRDRAAQLSHAGASGPLEIRALMPGKVIRVLVAPGASVSEGDGLVVVEAMKMQNEMKAPREGTVTSVPAIAGATVAAGATLIVLE